MDEPPVSDCCSICHGNFNIPHQSNCSHWYCGSCILQVWNHGSALQPCKCPLCRRQITLLVPSEASSQQAHNSEASEILKKIEAYNRLFGSQSSGLAQRMQDLPFLLKRLFRELMDPQRSLPFVIKARVYLALISTAIYVLSPVDIIPEALFGILGLLDDAIIALIFFLHVGTLYRAILLRRYGETNTKHRDGYKAQNYSEAASCGLHTISSTKPHEVYNNGINITFVNTESNHKRLLKHAGSHSLDVPGFQYKSLPDGLPATPNDDDGLAQTQVDLTMFLFANFYDSFLDLVAGLETPPTCIISDGFMTFSNIKNAAEKLKIPIMLYWTLAACGFMAYYQAKVLSEKGLVPLKDESYLTNGYSDTLIDWIPGMEKIRLRDLPELILATKPDDPGLKWLVDAAQMADTVPHMIVHSFDELEDNLIKELKSIFPNVYAIGPLQLHLNQITEKETVDSKFNGYSLWKEEPECIQWLQSKEANSVVYVNFGSLAVMSLQDLLELGWGLVNSNHYFLWIIRPDLVDGKPAVLPPELEEVIKGKGFIGSWCSQEEVLNHPSVGGFLTHGGWGSVIESLSAGVPMVCRPFSHDQRVNCRQMCKEWEVGMEIEGNLKRDVVEKLVRDLMDGIECQRLRKKAMEWKNIMDIATSPNGSSSLTIEKLTNEITMLSRK